MTDLTTVARLLEQLVAGDLSELNQLLLSSHATMEQARGEIGDLLLTRRAVLRVLAGLEAGTFDPQKVQQWASLMRRGYVPVAVPEGLPVRALDIEWEEEFEEQIAYVISRLDELGDIVDGKIDENEMTELILMLKQ